MAFSSTDADRQLSHWSSHTFLIREASTDIPTDAHGHGASESLCTAGVILLEDIHFCAPVAILCLFLLGTVLAEIIGFDVSGMETVIRQNRWLYGVG